jgi:hypothetical protein
MNLAADKRRSTQINAVKALFDRSPTPLEAGATGSAAIFVF